MAQGDMLLQLKSIASIKENHMEEAIESVAVMPNAAQIKEWVSEHNKFRCMHGVPPVTWSDPVAQDASKYITPLTKMKHADSYGVAPPAGPAGENLYWTSAQASPIPSVKAWYSEVNDCNGGPEGFTDGCANGVGGKPTGHFTAMIWKGVKTIGCATNANGQMTICRYKAGDSLSMDTPNMNKPSNYPNQVFKRVKTEAECSGAGGGGGGSASDSDDNNENDDNDNNKNDNDNNNDNNDNDNGDDNDNNGNKDNGYEGYPGRIDLEKMKPKVSISINSTFDGLKKGDVLGKILKSDK
eukprot:gnl/TRDRNA2_/TRDRNA2_174041_c0_seq4.p1 gnl/TRDRNA2_/TRDRNA2_174041_c0~~gnl/TRDRNA2_/TRDRNA2_174041_c0_seq4.p1  ORF type:complete len:334 (+),score=79.55 gnl/TRDRNA2_/TRDRNA2_174041_c0_seq4:114-1004(+)